MYILYSHNPLRGKAVWVLSMKSSPSLEENENVFRLEVYIKYSLRHPLLAEFVCIIICVIIPLLLFAYGLLSVFFNVCAECSYSCHIVLMGNSKCLN